MKNRTIILFLAFLCFYARKANATTNMCVGDTTFASCTGLSAILSAFPGGTWTSSDVSVATVNPSTGQIIAVGAGTATINYSATNSCGSVSIDISLVVNPVPVITGNFGLCVYATRTLSASVSGGTWSSVSSGVASINPTTGVVTGVSAGTSMISYVTPAGCFDTAIVTVGDTFSIHVCELFPIATCDTVIAYCNNLQLQVNATHSAGTGSYHWTGIVPTDSAKYASHSVFTLDNPPPSNGQNIITITDTYNGCTASTQVHMERDSICSPCEFFKPCVSGCIGCDTVPYFKTIIASELNSGNIIGGAHNYFIAHDAVLAVSPDPGNVFVMARGVGNGLTLTVQDEESLSGVHIFASPTCPWRGIEVKNNDPMHLGQLTIDSNTLIENASHAAVFMEGTASSPISNVPASGDIIYSNGAIYNLDNWGIGVNYFKLSSYPAGGSYPITIENNVFTNRNFCGYHADVESPTASDYYPYKWPSNSYLKTPTTTESGNNPGYHIDGFPGVNVPTATYGVEFEGTGYTDESMDAVHPGYNGIKVGDPEVNDSTNLFDTLNAGAYAFKSNVYFYNNIFRRNQNNSDGIRCEGADETKNQVQLLPGNISGNYNRLYNIKNGVYATLYYNFYSSHTAMKSTNYYYDNDSSQKYALNGYRFTNGIYDSIIVASDTMINIGGLMANGSDAEGEAIMTEFVNSSAYCSNAGTVVIRDNTITGLLSDTTYENGGYGVRVFDGNLSCNDVSLGSVYISSNNISGMVYGITVNAEDSIYSSNMAIHVDSNIVVLRDNDAAPAAVERYGIGCKYMGNGIEITHNLIYGDTTFENDTMLPMVSYNQPAAHIDSANGDIKGYIGIRLEQAIHNYFDNALTNVTCNYVHDLNIGFEFYANNRLNWRHNVMARNMFGMVLSQDGIIGQQGDYCDPIDNVWLTTPDHITGWPDWSYMYGTYCMNSDSRNSVLYIRIVGDVGSPYNPVTNGEGGGHFHYHYNGEETLVNAHDDCHDFPDTCTCAPIGYGDGCISAEHRGVRTSHTTPPAVVAVANNRQGYNINPNPSDGNIVIMQKTTVDGAAQVTVKNMLGDRVYDGSLTFKNGSSNLSMSKVARGVYMMELTDSCGNKSEFKFVIEK